MPTKHYTRTWCNTCKDFTLYHKPFEGEFQCKDCGDCSTSYKISDIPEDKYKEQIQRYKTSQSNKLGKVYATFLNPSHNPFFDSSPSVEIHEDDLGYEKIKSELIAKEKSEIKAKKEEQERLKALYKGLTRNDKCGCGSGLKFKNCCQPKIDEIIY
jgi:hypothetical protein